MKRMATDSLDAPKDISFDTSVVDLSCHPSKDVLAVGDIDGDVTVFSYSTTEKNHQLLTLPHHKKSCRALQFSPSGQRLFTVSKDKSLQMVDMDTGTVSQKIKQAHDSPLYSLLVVDENIVATGDDDGYLKVWDMRQNKAVMELKEHDEFISDMDVEKNKRYLVATSGDGTLSAFDIRKHKLKMQSELFDSELLSLAIVKGGSKVVCGSGEGVLNIFNWGEWGNLSDRFPGHPMSIDCLVPISQDIVITGSMDGVIRAVNLLPNRFLGKIGQHEDFPIENMSLSHCGSYLVSCSHDQLVKFWNIQGVSKETVSTKRKAKKGNKNKLLGKAAKNDFFAGLAESVEKEEKESESEEDSDCSESEESETDDGKEKVTKTQKNKTDGKLVSIKSLSGNQPGTSGLNVSCKDTHTVKEETASEDSDDLEDTERMHVQKSSFGGDQSGIKETSSDTSSESDAGS